MAMLDDIIIEEEKLYDRYLRLYEETGNGIFRDIADEKQTHLKYLREIKAEKK